jgi:diacylglycerol kinase family enzyme
MRTGQTVLIAYNPQAGASDRHALLSRLSERLRHLGLQPCLVAELATLQQQASDLKQAGMLHSVIAAGGDGTVAAVAERVAAETSIAIFPLGTENLLAKWLGSTQEIEPFCQAIVRAQTMHIDAMLANGRLALITLGVGFDAEVVRQVHCNRRGHITKWSYAWPIWRAFWCYPFPRLKVTIQHDPRVNATGAEQSTPAQPTAEKGEPPNGQQDVKSADRRTEPWQVHWLFVANLPSYAGGLSIIPDANPRDGLLDVASFSAAGRLKGLFYALWIALRRHRSLRDFSVTTAHSVRIESEGEVGYQLDGDYGGTLPLEIRVLPRRVRLVRFDCNSGG